jgi:hypothetical protein
MINVLSEAMVSFGDFPQILVTLEDIVKSLRII